MKLTRVSFALGAWLSVVGCGPTGALCTGDSDCQDGSFCNGWERCDPSSVRADRRGCAPGLQCDVIRNEYRYYEGPEAAGEVRCTEEVYGLGIYRRCAEREGKPRPGKGSPLNETYCSEPLEVDYAAQCHAHIVCVRDEDCDDGTFCNGVEHCEPSSIDADGRGCVPGASPCPGLDAVCSEEARSCGVPCEDADEDGSCSVASGGDDCDDQDAARFPGATEVCNDVDEDCDPATFGARDVDGDGYPDRACVNTGPGGEVFRGSDCDDSNPSIHPHLPEVCNGVDDNCNGVVDEGLVVSQWADADGDGFGAGPESTGCPGRAGYATRDGDCDDTNPHLFQGSIRCVVNVPGGYERCDKGTWNAAQCPGVRECIPQPPGFGVCI